MRIPAATFEGLFVRGLPPTVEFTRELQQAGFNTSRMEVDYGLATWDACMTVARRLHADGLSGHELEVRLGRAFARGYFDTMVGAIIRVGLPLLGMRGVIARLPRFVPMSFPSAEVEIVSLGDRAAHLRFSRLAVNAGFLEGVFTEASELLKTRPQFRADRAVFVPTQGHRFDLTCVW